MRMWAYAVAAMTVAGAVAVQAEEGQQPKPPRGEGRPPMGRIDKDGDGKVSVAEFAAMPAERAKMRFERLDADKDGKVTEAEFNAAKDKAPPRPEGSDRPQREMPAFGDLDANKDGSVTLEEATAHASAKATEKAKELDKDGDGFISRDEMPWGHGPGGGEGGPKRQGPPGGGSK